MSHHNSPYGYGAPPAQGPPPPVPPRQPPQPQAPPLQSYIEGQYYPPPPQQYPGPPQQYYPYPPPLPNYPQPSPGGYHGGPPVQSAHTAGSQSYYQHPPGPAQQSMTEGNAYHQDAHQYPPAPTGAPGAYSGHPPPPPPPLPQSSYTPTPSIPVTGAGNYPPLPHHDNSRNPSYGNQLATEASWSHGYDTRQPAPDQGTHRYPPHSSLGTSRQPTPSSYNPTPASTPAVSSPPPVPRQGDTFEHMASQFGNMSVNDAARQYAQSPAPARPRSHTPPPAPKPAPVIRRTGPYNEIIEECPESSPLTFALEWYRFPETPDFLICNACYAKHIRDSSLASSFERVKQPDGVPSSCRFWLPRMMDVLWPATLRTGDIGLLRDYVAKRSQIIDCQGQGGVSADVGVKWFSAKSEQLPGFVSCEACLEDRLIGTAFEDQFEPCPLAQRSGETWACDVCIDYISKAITKFSSKGRNDWPACVAAIERRMNTPACQGKIVNTDSCKWYTPRKEIYDFVVCETCYLDKIALGEFEHEFCAYGSPKPSALGVLGAALLTGEDSKPQQSICDMANFSTNIALDGAKNRHDFSVWWKAANTIRDAPACTANGLKGETWYTLLGGCSNLDICVGCYAGVVEPLGLAHLFQVGTRASSDEVVCDFNTAQPRFASFMLRLVQSILVGVFEPFESYVRKFAGIPPCQGSTFLVNAVWYGFADATFCTDCYETVVVGSSLDAVLQLKGVQDPRATMCCLYSPRMRLKWQEACAAGSAAEFIAFAKHRAVVYQNTMTVIEAMEKMKIIKMQQAMHQSLLSIQYQGMAGMREIADTTDGYSHRYGGQSYTSWEGAHAAQLMDSSREGMANAVRGDDIMLRAQLMTQWKAVE